MERRWFSKGIINFYLKSTPSFPYPVFQQKVLRIKPMVEIWDKEKKEWIKRS